MVKIVKISQHLAKIWTKYNSLVFWAATLCTRRDQARHWLLSFPPNIRHY